MNDPKLTALFAQWIDATLAVKLPDGIAAFHFNLYDCPDTHDVEIVGCPLYDPSDSDWACDDIFMSRKPRFELPHDIVGQHWERGLQAASQMLKTYLETNAPGSQRMRESQAVSVGFVDGDLHLLWSR